MRQGITEKTPDLSASGSPFCYTAGHLRMLDLCCGLKGASQAMSEAGWDVLTLDNDERFNPDVVADVRGWEYTGPQLDLIWASSPCTEFSRESMPWCRTGKTPDMSITLGCKRIIDLAKPKYWVMENVRGAIKYFQPILGQPRASFGPFFLWGYFPIIGPQTLHDFRKKESYSSKQVAERAKVPEQVSKAILDSIERRPMLFDYSAV